MVLVLTKTVLVLKNLQGLGLAGDGLNYITVLNHYAKQPGTFKSAAELTKSLFKDTHLTKNFKNVTHSNMCHFHSQRALRDDRSDESTICTVYE